MIQCKPMQSANSYDRYDGIRFVIRSIPIRETHRAINNQRSTNKHAVNQRRIDTGYYSRDRPVLRWNDSFAATIIHTPRYETLAKREKHSSRRTYRHFHLKWCRAIIRGLPNTDGLEGRTRHFFFFSFCRPCIRIILCRNFLFFFSSSKEKLRRKFRINSLVRILIHGQSFKISLSLFNSSTLRIELFLISH